MSREVFEQRYAREWGRLAAALAAARARGSADLGTELPELHRRVGHHLALARERGYGTDLEDRLNRLALEAHERLYARRRGGVARLASLFFHEFPRRVRAEAALVLLASALLIVPAIGMFVATLVDRGVAETVLPAATADAIAENYAPERQKPREAEIDVVMFAFYVRNNVGIALRTYGSGILFGVGAVFVLVYNGLFLGAFAGEIGHLGYGATFTPFVIGHGAFELTAIALAGAAGLRLGGSLLVPGARTRAGALRVAARESLGLVSGAAVYLVVAAFLEAFWSSSQALSPATKVAAGLVFWALVLAHLLLGGRRGP